MDLKKFQLFTSGLTEEEKEKIAIKESAENVFKKERNLVISTAKTPGFRIIINKMVAELEYYDIKLRNCSEKELKKLQVEIKVRKDFLDKWSPYLDN